MTTIPIFVSFLAGLVSFLSPCILPLIPGYLAYLAGVAGVDTGRQQRAIFINSVWFVLGFSVIFAVLGVLLNTALSHVAYDAQIWLARLGGVVIIIFGLYLTGLLKIGFLEREHKLTVTRKFSSQYLTSFVFGAAFAAGWTPCVGAVLGSILGLAASAPGSAFALLLAYAIGLGIPFLVVGLFTAQASRVINKYGVWALAINRIFGVLLIVLGVLVFTQNLNRLASFELVGRILQL